MKWLIVSLGILLAFFYIHTGSIKASERSMIDIQMTIERLQDHLRTLTISIGERSVLLPENLKRTAEYIESFYREIGIPVHSEPFPRSLLEYGYVCHRPHDAVAPQPVRAFAAHPSSSRPGLEEREASLQDRDWNRPASSGACCGRSDGAAR